MTKESINQNYSLAQVKSVFIFLSLNQIFILLYFNGTILHEEVKHTYTETLMPIYERKFVHNVFTLHLEIIIFTYKF